MNARSTAAGSAAVAEIDPITFEIIRHRLQQVMYEMIIALENVSGSPITNEGHDTMASLYRADGSLMVGGSGYIHHLPSAAEAVKHIIRSFADDPGIDEGDAFFLNDSYTAALHTSDVYIISPIHFDGELRGFVSNFVHVTDIGAVSPGGFCPEALDNYQEGFQTKGLKIVERGKPRRDVIETFLNMVRDPGMTALDLKSQLAANHVAKERMHALYAEYGVAVVDAVSEELIRQSEALVRQRLGELADGTWYAREYIDLPEGDYKIELAMTKEGDGLLFDFGESSPQAPLGVNCCYWATWGAIFAPIFPLLAWDVTWNEGVLRPVRMVVPERSIVNCSRPAPTSLATTGAIQIVNNLTTLTLSKMFGASRAYWDRATAVWGQHAHVETHGFTGTGEFFIAPLTDTLGGAGGARAFKDGVDAGGEIPNVVSRIANAESQELNTPMVYVYRRVVPDSGGPGKFRGGVSFEYAFTPNKTGGRPMGVVVFGEGTRAPRTLGVFGGYPGCNAAYATYRQADVRDLPRTFEQTGAQNVETTYWGHIELEPGDAQHVRFMGGGGYGDPLDREPEAVALDLRRGFVTAGPARDVYGVVVDPATGQVDRAATMERRLELRAARLGRAIPATPPRVVQRRPLRIGEYLDRTEDGATACGWCGETFAPLGADWQDHAVARRLPLSAAGPGRPDSGSFTLLELLCPGCGTLLETQLLGEGDSPLYDRVRRWPDA